MANFSTASPVPALTSTYTDVLSIINQKFTDVAKGLPTTDAAITNLPADSIRWNPTLNKWTKGDGATDLAASNTYSINISGNAGTVTNGVYTSGNQTIGGTKTFSSTIVGSISGNAATATSATNATNSSNISITDDTTSTSIHYIYLGTGTSGNNATKVSSTKLSFIPSSGDLTAAGNITAYSDLNLKTDLKQISSALDKVLKLTGYTYTRKDTGAKQTGLVAQDVQQVLPEAVSRSGEYLSVAYGNMLGLIVEAIKELNTKISNLNR